MVFFPSFFRSLLGCGDTLFLDMTFLFLTLITLLLNGGQLHRLMVEKRPYFISLEVVHQSDFNHGIQHTQWAMGLTLFLLGPTFLSSFFHLLG